MSIQNQALFYYRNVCDYESSIKSDVTLSGAVIAGLAEYSDLLRTTYQDWRSYETSTVPSERTKIGIMTDDLENYHNLTNTLDCLFAVTTVGELCSEGVIQYLSVQKNLFKSEYKKSVTFSFKMLEKYGFYFCFFKGDKAVDEYKRCDNFQFCYENGEHLIDAINFIAHQFTKKEKKKEMPPKVAFMLADYYFILTGNVNQNPTQQSILNTLGALSEIWEELVRVMQDECGLIADSSFNPYVFPNRTVTFKYNKNTICKFGINVDRLNIRLPLSFEAAKDLITKRTSLPQSINHNIDLFDCINCGKCENKSNIVIVDGVPLCNLPYSNFVTEDSRCLRFDITADEEVKVICDIIRKL
ncbi:MAG: hypothetical protein PHH84_02685 [Oscillospiraceae bacterium]|nr:hypothetical protein [Oscillospiraceae bacterium]MDD4414774.1 hypothetical protein [Oscillospiraceae bacterium]